MLDKFIPDFVSQDPLRPALTHAHTVDGFVYASGGHICIKSPATNFLNAYVTPDGEKVPDFKKIRNDANISEIAILIDRAALDEALTGLPRVDKFKDCNECLGAGEIECLECGQDYECPVCKGEGHQGGKIGECFHKDSSIRFGHAIFDANFFDVMLKIADYLERPIHWLPGNNSGVYFFGIGDTEIWMAARMTTEKHHVEFRIEAPELALQE